MNKGYTIFELLVAMALSLIIGAGLYTFYTTVFRENISKGSLVKEEQEAFILVDQLIKDFQSIGFGVDYNNLNKCVNGTNDGLEFLSLSAATDEVNSGCWGFTDINGKVNLFNSYDILGRPCNNSGKYLVMDTSKRLKDVSYDPSNPNPNYKNMYAFYVGSKSYPNDFKVSYFTDNTNLPKECAPGTFNLQKRTGTTTISPVISCVLNFKIRYIGNDGNFYDTLNDINNLQGLKLCMIVQVGREQSTPENPPNYSANGGCTEFNFSNPNFSKKWRYYRWVVIEQSIPLKNIRQ
ncbi:PulJ/GspJ family protein [Sulfurihydrogenibium sp.]|uniref:PulJ/GspJ family protein n=1 Tax=Sulfurihydrogenibium sp. TaxID=2053621 RepID=UPI003D0BF21A